MGSQAIDKFWRRQHIDCLLRSRQRSGVVSQNNHDQRRDNDDGIALDSVNPEPEPEPSPGHLQGITLIKVGAFRGTSPPPPRLMHSPETKRGST
jgi:hypothetical protein